MDANDLRNHALATLHRRLALPRSYSLTNEDGPRMTVHAAIVEGHPDEVTETNPSNRKELRRSAEAGNDGTFVWLNAIDGKAESLSLAQIRFLAGRLTEFCRIMYDFNAKVCGEINAGTITTPEQVDRAAWPS
jgi:hypothetical protein